MAARTVRRQHAVGDGVDHADRQHERGVERSRDDVARRDGHVGVGLRGARHSGHCTRVEACAQQHTEGLLATPSYLGQGEAQVDPLDCMQM